MKSAHDNIVNLADKLRLTDKTRGQLISMRKEVLEKIREPQGYQKYRPESMQVQFQQEITTGSFYRQTATENQSDIDVVVAFNFKPIDGNKKFPSSLIC